ncbi:MAG: glycine cleavage T C-terminal barrel domain-containing protein, partial [Hyphomicrobiales bacterium]
VAPNVADDLVAAGAVAGKSQLAGCLKDGAQRGAYAASGAGFKAVANGVPTVDDEPDYTISPLWNVTRSTGKAFIDYQNDVTAKDITLAAREGYTDVELAKRYTTLGMATDQGKLSNINGLAILAQATGKTIAQVGTTTYRPYYSPVSFGALTGANRGHHFQPVRRTPMHEWAQLQGAVFVEAGLWLRAQWFPRDGETDWLQSVVREVKNTRTNVGVCDVSTLGKIDVQGPDAAEFMNRLYCNGWKLLKVGRARYGLMLREDGMVFDDGTASRLADDHYFMTTTTANAGPVMAHMEFCHQALWPELDVQYSSVTEQWAQMAVAGPQARRTLQKIIAQDISNEAFPYMGAQAVTVGDGIAGRLFRISFSGELAFEISVPADYGDTVVRQIMQAGQEFSIMAYGTEALSVMRIEKGHVAGAELNGTTTVYDFGLGKMMSTKKDYIGRQMAAREAFHQPDRWNVVGLLPVDRGGKILSGAHVLKIGDTPSMASDQGYVTSVAYSPMIGQWIALGLVSNGRARHGEEVLLWDGLRDNHLRATICDPVFYDKEHVKLNG